MVDSFQAGTWRERAFCWGLSALTVLAVGRVVWDWFDRRQLLRQEYVKDPGPFGNYVIVHTNSSLLTHLCLAAVVGIGVLQIALVWAWQSRLARRWWRPPVIELFVFVAFGLVAAQTAGHYAFGCWGSSYSGNHCNVAAPDVLHNGWLAVWAVTGMVVGLLWTLSAGSKASDAANDSQWTARSYRIRNLNEHPQGAVLQPAIRGSLVPRWVAIYKRSERPWVDDPGFNFCRAVESSPLPRQSSRRGFRTSGT